LAQYKKQKPQNKTAKLPNMTPRPPHSHPSNKPQKKTTTMPESEDLSRYTAPPDSIPEPPTYSTAGILAYVESWIPNCPYYSSNSYTLEEVAEILHEAADNLTDEDYGIEKTQ